MRLSSLFHCSVGYYTTNANTVEKTALNKITTRCVQDTRPWDCCRKQGAVLKEWEEKSKKKKFKWRKKEDKDDRKANVLFPPTGQILHKIGGGLDGRGTEKKCSPPARVAP